MRPPLPCARLMWVSRNLSVRVIALAPRREGLDGSSLDQLSIADRRVVDRQPLRDKNLEAGSAQKRVHPLDQHAILEHSAAQSHAYHSGVFAYREGLVAQCLRKSRVKHGGARRRRVTSIQQCRQEPRPVASPDAGRITLERQGNRCDWIRAKRLQPHRRLAFVTRLLAYTEQRGGRVKQAADRGARGSINAAIERSAQQGTAQPRAFRPGLAAFPA